MELYEWIEKVNSREDLVKFINLLRKDLQMNKDEWENANLADFLEAMEAWVNDMEGFYPNANQAVSEKQSWKMIANILYASKMYE
ncbi:hypothetical protein [Neobacillus sp. YIM B06451]|uniref:DUF7660 family protein n=1 Tax=Neobacillus sp. YIM B06451 TaxID=3070994 RepID=UPI00292E45BB|nr:hypothetical protein [Neobacillus sp. YIM B06451]